MKTNKLHFACIGIAAAALSGCASTAEIQREMYSQRVSEQSKIDQSKTQLEAARYVYGSKLTDPSAQLAFAISDGIASALRATGAGQTQLPPMPVIEGWDDKLLRFAGILAPVAANVAGSVMQYKTGIAQTLASRDIALGDQRARVDTIAAVSNGMGAAGASAVNANAATAAAGYTAIGNVATAGFVAATSLGNNIQGTAASGFVAATAASTNAANVAINTNSTFERVNVAGLTAVGAVAGSGFGAMTAQSANAAALGVSLGNNLQGAAASGATAAGTIANAGFVAATALGARVTNVTNTNVTGNHNATALQSSTATVTAPTTNTNNCPGASGGNGAPSGNTGNTGNGGGTGNTGNGGSGSSTTGTSPGAPSGVSGPGAPSGVSGATGTGGAGTAGAVNCTNTPPAQPPLKQ